MSLIVAVAPLLEVVDSLVLGSLVVIPRPPRTQAR
jgi:hypothetical protein